MGRAAGSRGGLQPRSRRSERISVIPAKAVTNTHARLVYMANQIARNFATMGDVDAARATADHIASFWDPRMRAAIRCDDEGLSPVAAAAFEELRRRGPPPPQTRATQFAGPDGEGGQDAG